MKLLILHLEVKNYFDASYNYIMKPRLVPSLLQVIGTKSVSLATIYNVLLRPVQCGERAVLSFE